MVVDVLLTAKRSRVEFPSKAVDLLQDDSSVLSELLSQAGASLSANGSPVQLRKLLCVLLSSRAAMVVCYLVRLLMYPVHWHCLRAFSIL